MLALAAGGAAAAALTSLPGCSTRGSREAEDTPAPAPTGTARPGATTHPEPGPAELRSSDGLLRATLVVRPELIAHGAGSRWALTVNGRTPGPTLRLRPGDRLQLTIDNQTGHSTNLHTHGLRVSPEGNSDNPFIEIKDGERFEYDIQLPRDHPGGTFWYHPHLHHHVAEQLFAGFFGPIVVEDDVDALPALATARDRLVLLHDTRIGSTEAAVIGASPMDQRMGRQGEVLVNGERQPVFRAEAGRLERWRVLNASSSRFYRLTLDAHPFHVIATDAGRLAAPREAAELALVPGERLELLVQPKTAGAYSLRTLATSRGSMGMAGGAITTPESQLATFEVAGSASPASLPATLAALEDLRTLPQPRTREVVFSMQGQMGGAAFLIDGKSFSGDRVDIRLAAGTVEDWIVRNTSPMDHPFHLHVWPFQLMESSSAGPVKSVEWKDTVNVPANSWVRLRIPFTAITGKTVFHCHILDHEDLGMMATIEVR